MHSLIFITLFVTTNRVITFKAKTMKPVQYLELGGKWKNLIVMGQTITDMSSAIEIVRASKIKSISLQQIDRVGVLEWDNF